MGPVCRSGCLASNVNKIRSDSAAKVMKTITGIQEYAHYMVTWAFLRSNQMLSNL